MACTCPCLAHASSCTTPEQTCAWNAKELLARLQAGESCDNITAEVEAPCHHYRELWMDYAPVYIDSNTTKLVLNDVSPSLTPVCVLCDSNCLFQDTKPSTWVSIAHLCALSTMMVVTTFSVYLQMALAMHDFLHVTVQPYPLSTSPVKKVLQSQ